MMTHGVIQLFYLLNEQKEAIGVEQIYVNYNYDADIISIAPSCFRCGLEATDQACGEVINRIRGYAALQDGKPYNPRGSAFTNLFEQEGYNLTGAPKDLRQQIDKMFVITVSITQNAAPGAKPEDRPVGKAILKKIECEAPLLGTSYSVKHPREPNRARAWLKTRSCQIDDKWERRWRTAASPRKRSAMLELAVR